MELDDLKAEWSRNDQRLDEILFLNRQLLRTSRTDRVRSSLTKLSRGTIATLIVDVLVLILIGSFLGDHFREAKFFLPALALHLAAIASLVATIGQLVLLRSIDSAAPVVEIQKRLLQLRTLRIRTTKWTFMIIPLLWVPLLIVSIRALGIDPYAFLPAKWLVANVIFGVAFLATAWWAARRHADRFRSPFTQQLMDDIAGRSLNAASREMRELAEFEHDEA